MAEMTATVEIIAVHTYEVWKWLPRILCSFGSTFSHSCVQCSVISRIDNFTIRDSPTMSSVGSASCPGCDSLSSSSTAILDCISRAWLLGEGCVSLVAEYGENLPSLGTELLPAAFQNVKMYILVSLPNLLVTFQLRRPLVPAKRMAIVLHWLAQASSYSELAAMYAIGKSTVVAIVREGVTILWDMQACPEVILFPTGQELDRVMVDCQALCRLPCCVGALDGTFMSMKKPSNFGDTYFCYKNNIE